MVRLPRYEAVGIPQHVIQRGNNRAALFIDPVDYGFYRRCLQSAAERYGCLVHAYVLMTNHVHLLVTPTTLGAIGKVMQSVGNRYVQRFNGAHQRTGTLWEGRYRATVIDTDRYLFTCYRYIELNPVRAGLTSRPDDYHWSSHRANALGWRDSLITPHERYQALGTDAAARRSAYRALFSDVFDQSTLQRIREATNGGWALGDDQFHHELARFTQRRPRPAYRRRSSRFP